MSTTGQTPATRQEKTIDLEQVFGRIRHGYTLELLNIFDRWPLGEIRREVIRRLMDLPHEVAFPHAERVEEQIRQLHANHERDYWEGLFSWYIFNSSPTGVAVRAIEFAIGFSEEFREGNTVAKEISGRLKKSPGLYWEIPSLRGFIDELISGSALEYSSYQWTQAERAIRRIVQVRDITYLPQIEKLLDLFEKGVYKPTLRDGDEFSFGQNLQFLKDTVRILKQAQQEQTPDLNVAVGSYLREQAGLTGSVIVRLEYQQEIATDKLTVPVKVVVRLELSDPAEAAKLVPVLGPCRIKWWGEGFTGTKFLDVDKPEDSWGIGFNDQLQCGFSTFPSRGSNRFWLTFVDGEKEFAKVARYLIVG